MCGAALVTVRQVFLVLIPALVSEIEPLRARDISAQRSMGPGCRNNSAPGVRLDPTILQRQQRFPLRGSPSDRGSRPRLNGKCRGRGRQLSRPGSDAERLSIGRLDQLNQVRGVGRTNAQVRHRQHVPATLATNSAVRFEPSRPGPGWPITKAVRSLLGQKF
jgi:hypothetical protein